MVALTGNSIGTKKKGYFESEQELQIMLSEARMNFERSQTITMMRREVPVGGCIPDIIYVRFADIPDPSIWPSKWTFRHTFAIWLLRQHAELTLDAMAQRFYEPPNGRIKSTMQDLVKSGAVILTKLKTFTLSEKIKNIDAEVIAGEAKLSYWQRALEQALSYRRFADKVFVAMDSCFIPHDLEILEIFSRHSVGLCAVFPYNKLDWIVYPRKNERKVDADWDYLVASASVNSSGQTLWSARYPRKASNQAPM